ncbi:hypothetical protein OsI_30815 [Oryza sativa Indica Group]|uniref:Uncharacterized protein n=1 Tax=Oryza sativa subsp. indica TaxID=39946 RepID=B8BE79_ORYSI|nr:hypothetical protein OsI_30815 [Oryza sativa Indica Group]
MVLDAFESYLGELLAETMKEEDSMVLGVSEEIRKLNGTLSSLKKFLYNAEKKLIASNWIFTGLDQETEGKTSQEDRESLFSFKKKRLSPVFEGKPGPKTSHKHGLKGETGQNPHGEQKKKNLRRHN